MDIDELITNVQVNPPIWDKRVKGHSNRIIVDACWKKISSEMKINEAALRKKWKYLRDQFSVELSKITLIRSSDLTKTAEPKWPYFKKMTFLKDIVAPRACSSKLRPKTITTLDEDDIEAQFDQPAILSASDIISVMGTNALYDEKRLQLEQQKINNMQSTFQQEPYNDDLMFFKSLLPFVSKIPIEHKLRFRNHIQQVVQDYAFMGMGSNFEPSSTELLTIVPSRASPALSTPLSSPATSSNASRESPEQKPLL
ncbi:uncharacterized protein LOC114331341 [Diabrotica virgifera virgifera]|uniref:Uncharacterized protein LOC114331341 n=1 Tax=Diabrotica virgifera virgifera TaxID=50390 RepID=A0A6P7FUS6_DIAVI|nr:uncharacterized protein LOC114331341 [Diabrotica virgifera virgifera]